MNINRFKIDSGVAALETRYGNLLIDEQDIELLTSGELEIKPEGYVRIRNKKNKRRYFLHRLIIGALDGFEVDHINQNPLDNRRCNLRVCSRAENARNSAGHCNRKSKFKGVIFDKGRNGCKPYRAYTRVNGKRIWFGYYATELEAAKSYNENALKLFGEFASLNDLIPRPIGSSPPKPTLGPQR